MSDAVNMRQYVPLGRTLEESPLRQCISLFCLKIYYLDQHLCPNNNSQQRGRKLKGYPKEATRIHFFSLPNKKGKKKTQLFLAAQDINCIWRSPA